MAAILLGLAVVACAGVALAPTMTAAPGPTGQPSPTAAALIRYVALGDSYTIGTSVGAPERWPNQLVDRLAGRVPLELVANLGVNGYTSGDLILDELPRLDELRPDFVTLLVGVNDVVRGVPAATYRANMKVILDDLLEFLPAGRMVIVSTPDYTRTPSGGAFGDPVQQRAAIGDFNDLERAMAEEHGIAFVDISSVADRADREAGLVARDGLHPSGEQYRRWVDLVAPVVERLLTEA